MLNEFGYSFSDQVRMSTGSTMGELDPFSHHNIAKIHFISNVFHFKPLGHFFLFYQKKPTCNEEQQKKSFIRK